MHRLSDCCVRKRGRLPPPHRQRRKRPFPYFGMSADAPQGPRRPPYALQGKHCRRRDYRGPCERFLMRTRQRPHKYPRTVVISRLVFIARKHSLHSWKRFPKNYATKDREKSIGGVLGNRAKSFMPQTKRGSFFPRPQDASTEAAACSKDRPGKNGLRPSPPAGIAKGQPSRCSTAKEKPPSASCSTT